MSASAGERPGSGSRRSLLRDVNPWAGLPLLFFHAGSLLVFAVGASIPALVAFAVVYWMQIFGISAGFHRYFAHRSFRTSRAFQLVLAVVGCTASQMGPLWWASHHRRHHRFSDSDGDLHSPARDGFLWSHVGWILCDEYAETDAAYVKDWARFPELRFLDRFRWLPPLAVGAICFLAGAWLERSAPHLGATGPQLLVWGWLVATTVCYQVTFCINSLTHMIGRRRFETGDDSRNSLLLALLTNGEGWHNNHHRYPSSERQGFYWWEVDLTHYLLTALSKLGLVWGLKGPPPAVLDEGRAADGG